MFEVSTVHGRRVNVFQSGEGKRKHQDRNAFQPENQAGNLTISFSSGSSRTFRFQSLDEGGCHDITLRDGDILVFDRDVNSAFTHEVLPGPGKRVSLVIWASGRLQNLMQK
eukprot:10850357-Karenia_brevis.AAC.1